MFPLPPTAPLACVRAFASLGFQIVKENSLGVVLARGDRRVVMRTTGALLSEAEMALLLVAAHVSWLDFAAAVIPVRSRNAKHA
jgi:hypothetical protein